MQVKLVGMVASCLLVSNCTSPSDDASSHETDTAAQAEAAFMDYVDAVNAQDVEAVADIYDASPGFHWVERGRVQYETPEEAAQSYQATLEVFTSSRMTVDDVRVAALSNTSALVSAHYDFAAFDEAGEQTFGFDGWMTVGMAKREDGWKIAGGQTGPGREDEPQ